MKSDPGNLLEKAIKTQLENALEEHERDEDEMLFEFKRLTAVSKQPAIDFVRDPDAPIALLGRAS